MILIGKIEIKEELGMLILLACLFGYTFSLFKGLRLRLMCVDLNAASKKKKEEEGIEKICCF